jgi:hypothetical protein
VHLSLTSVVVLLTASTPDSGPQTVGDIGAAAFSASVADELAADVAFSCGDCTNPSGSYCRDHAGMEECHLWTYDGIEYSRSGDAHVPWSEDYYLGSGTCGSAHTLGCEGGGTLAALFSDHVERNDRDAFVSLITSVRALAVFDSATGSLMVESVCGELLSIPVRDRRTFRWVQRVIDTSATDPE